MASHSKPSTPHGHTPSVHEPVDAWHDHAHDPKPQFAHSDQANVRQVVGIGLVLALAVAGASAGVWGFYRWYVAKELNLEEVVSPTEPNSRLAPTLAVRWEKEAQLKLWENGGTQNLPAPEGEPAKEVSIRPIQDAKKDVVQMYAQKAGKKAASRE
ncbi:MAG: hypothetical protein K2Q20_13560 [Phycisphaerales bacterium]|nr:hypothetical protein [Phycisphaerales bacterium]